MLRTELIELVNSGEAWAFVGAGVSADAGGPTWQLLMNETVRVLGNDVTQDLQKDRRFERARSNYDYARSFSLIEQAVGRASLEGAVREVLPQDLIPGKLTSGLTDWPFAGYITSNYDSLLEKSLASQAQVGWAPIGNVGDEPRKMSGTPSKVVWHIHG